MNFEIRPEPSIEFEVDWDDDSEIPETRAGTEEKPGPYLRLRWLELGDELVASFTPSMRVVMDEQLQRFRSVSSWGPASGDWQPDYRTVLRCARHGYLDLRRASEGASTVVVEYRREVVNDESTRYDTCVDREFERKLLPWLDEHARDIGRMLA